MRFLSFIVLVFFFLFSIAPIFGQETKASETEVTDSPAMASFLGVTGEGNISWKTLQAAKGIRAIPTDPDLKIQYVVKEFTLSVEGNGLFTMMSTKDNKLTTGMLKALKSAEAGSIVKVEDVKVSVGGYPNKLIDAKGVKVKVT